MFNKLSTSECEKLFKNDSWYKPMLHFSSYPVKDLTLKVVCDYLDDNNLSYELDDYKTFNDDNFKIDISVMNNSDLYCISKRDGTHFYTDHAYNIVFSIAYMDNPPAYSDEIIVNIEHKSGWLMDGDEWKYWLENRNEINNLERERIREEKLLSILDNEDLVGKMSKDFNIHLLRQMRYFMKTKSNPFINSVYEFFGRKGYITDKQLEKVKSIMYYNKGLRY